MVLADVINRWSCHAERLLPEPEAFDRLLAASFHRHENCPRFGGLSYPSAVVQNGIQTMHDKAGDVPAFQLSRTQRARLNATWRAGLLAARAAHIIKQIESAPPSRGDNAERRKKRIEIIRLYAGVGQPPLTQVQIADRLSLTKQRVQYILAQVGLDQSLRVKPALTPKFLRYFVRRMKDHLAAAGYRQCSDCRIVQLAEKMAVRSRGPWKALCKPCDAAEMREYRKTGTRRPKDGWR